MPSIGDTTRPEYIYDQATDTWIPVGIGPHAHTPAAIGAIASSVVTTKGDIIAATGSGVVVRQGVGADGSMLVADSSQADGLNYALGNAFAAGKNKIINGDFGVWQRGTSYSGTLVGNYLADRWWLANGSGPVEQSTDVPNGFTYSIFNNSAGTIVIGTPIELPATGKSFFVAGETVTLSFYAKATSSSSIPVNLYYRNAKFDATNQSVFTTSSTPVTATTSWARYSLVYTVPAVNSTNTIIGLELGGFAPGVKITGVQLEAGSVATAFQTASGSLQGELTLCQRYYYRLGGNAIYEPVGAMGIAYSTTQSAHNFTFPQMRVAPTSLEFSTLAISDVLSAPIACSNVILSTDKGTKTAQILTVTGGGLTPFRSYMFLTNASTNGYLALNAEL
jgi:hypothetical protein